jgi:hypothetical protein
MNEDVPRRICLQRLKRKADGKLPRVAAGDEADAFNSGEGLFRHSLGACGYGDDDRVDAGLGESLDRTANCLGRDWPARNPCPAATTTAAVWAEVLRLFIARGR